MAGCAREDQVVSMEVVDADLVQAPQVGFAPLRGLLVYALGDLFGVEGLAVVDYEDLHGGSIQGVFIYRFTRDKRVRFGHPFTRARNKISYICK
ncbi:MAG TPA: hypothetical protein VM050_04120 [Patescibacteria group bacterium]|nr:hypothetical protein [Patescibacteria group bacterium]